MDKPINEFTGGTASARDKLNAMRALVNAFDQIKGDGLIAVQRTPAGIIIRLAMDRVLERIPKFGTSSTGGIFPVKVTMDGGEGGSASADCSYTYSVDDENGKKIAEDMTPEAPRIPKTQYTAGDGWGWGFGEGDDFILLDAGEKEVAEVIT
jgi:hypothetical protein